MKKSFTLLFLFCALGTINYLNAQGSWAALTSGTTVNLLGVSTPSSAVCYVCGATGTIRKTSNTGLTWVPLSSGTGQNLYSIRFLDILTGFVVGDNGTALKTTNGGSTWSPMTVGTTSNLRYVYFIDATTGFISGAGGLILKTTDGGTSWSTLTTGTAALLNSVFFTTASVGYATGAAGTIIKTTTSGSSWTPVTSGVSSTLGIVYFPTSSNASICGDNGIILRTTTSGASWSTVASGTTDNLTGLDFIDPSNGFMVGGNAPLNTGNILQTTDGGASWTSFLPGSSRLTRVDYFDANLAYAVGLDGTILQWTIPLPPATADAQFSSSAPGCVGQSENFYSVMAGIPGVTHSWDFGIGAIPATSTLYNPSSVVYASSGAKVVTHIVTTGTGSDTITNIITINPSPLASFTSTAPVCSGATVDFVNSGSTGSGITYSWDFGAGASPLISTAQNPSGIIYNFGGSKTVTFNVLNQYGCITTTTQNISIDSLPQADAGADSTICFNTSINIGSTAISGMTYSWVPSSTLSGATSATPIVNPIATLSSYFLTVTNTSTGCVNKDTVQITMLPALFADAGSDAAICKNDMAQIGTGSMLGQTYSWSPSTGLTDSTLSNPFAGPTSTTTYTLTVTGNGCTPATDEVTIIVHPAPTVSAGMDDTTTVGSPVQLNASGGILYSWSPAAGLDNPGIYNPMACPETTTTYTVTVTDPYGCVRGDAVTVYIIEPSFWVPTAFTPDGNGISDVFYIRGEGIQDLEFTIFNRWGEQIFLTRDILTGWDGTRQANGDKLPGGAYVYQIKGSLSDGTPVFSKGMINLIR
jgi:gliding motility-associated-like protein